MRGVAILCVILAMSGCSSRALYENAQYNKRNECLRLPPSQFEDCMASAHQTYDEYRKAREEVIDR